MKIFLTGASGFIGSYILKNLLMENNQIVISLREGSSLNFDSKNKFANLKILRSELKDIEIEELDKFDLVLHLAAKGVSPQKASIQDFLNTNINDTISLFLKCEKAGVKKFYTFGSSHEYGLSSDDYEYIPANAPLQPTTIYASSKVATFLMLSNYAKKSKMKFAYSRLFNIYGFGQNKNNFWPQLYSASKSGRDFKMSSGKQILDFMEVEEVAKEIIAKSKKDIFNDIGIQVDNLASGKAISLKDFAINEWERLDSKGDLIFGAIPDRINEFKRVVAKVS